MSSDVFKVICDKVPLTDASVVSPGVVGAVVTRDVGWVLGEVAVSRGEVGMAGGEMIHYIVKTTCFAYISEVITIKIIIDSVF